MSYLVAAWISSGRDCRGTTAGACVDADININDPTAEIERPGARKRSICAGKGPILKVKHEAKITTEDRTAKAELQMRINNILPEGRAGSDPDPDPEENEPGDQQDCLAISVVHSIQRESVGPRHLTLITRGPERHSSASHTAFNFMGKTTRRGLGIKITCMAWPLIQYHSSQSDEFRTSSIQSFSLVDWVSSEIKYSRRPSRESLHSTPSGA